MRRIKKRRASFSKTHKTLIWVLSVLLFVEMIFVIDLQITGNPILKTVEKGVGVLDGTSLKSAVPKCTPEEEVCDGVDNDCDGLEDSLDSDCTCSGNGGICTLSSKCPVGYKKVYNNVDYFCSGSAGCCLPLKVSTPANPIER